METKMEKDGKITEISQAPPRNYLQIGSLVFAVINIIGTIVAIAVTCYWVYWQAMFIVTSRSNYRDPDQGLFFMLICLMEMALSFIAFAFSIILVKGLLKRKASYVKAYFVYGIVMIVMFLMYDVALCGAFIIPLLGISIIYSAILAMIWATYKKIEYDSQYQHSTLVERF